MNTHLTHSSFLLLLWFFLNTCVFNTPFSSCSTSVIFYSQHATYSIMFMECTCNYASKSCLELLLSAFFIFNAYLCLSHCLHFHLAHWHFTKLHSASRMHTHIDIHKFTQYLNFKLAFLFLLCHMHITLMFINFVTKKSAH